MKTYKRNARQKYLWAVRVYEGCGRKGGWVVMSIRTNKDLAERIKDQVKEDIYRDYPMIDPVVNHPTRDELCAYLLCGNLVF